MFRAVLTFLPVICTLLLFSCKRDEILSIDVSADSLLIKKIRIQDLRPDYLYDKTFTPVYDAAGRKMDVYLDDPLTPDTDRDELVYRYEFNADGYLIALYTHDSDRVFRPMYTILRNNANQIKHILHADLEYWKGVSDTLYFSYSGNTVRDSFQTYLGEYLSHTMTFNEKRQPVYIKKEEEYYARHTWYSYNSQDQLTTEIYKDIIAYDTTDHVYDTRQVSDAWMQQSAFFLGKDTWLLNCFETHGAISFNFVGMFLDYAFLKAHSPMQSAPHASKTMHGYNYYSYDVPARADFQFINTYTTSNMLATQTITGDSGYPIVFTFSY